MPGTDRSLTLWRVNVAVACRIRKAAVRQVLAGRERLDARRGDQVPDGRVRDAQRPDVRGMFHQGPHTACRARSSNPGPLEYVWWRHGAGLSGVWVADSCAVDAECPLCQLERLAYWCRDCDLDFCEACFSDIHSVRKARTHRRFAVEGTREHEARHAAMTAGVDTDVMVAMQTLPASVSQSPIGRRISTRM